MSWSGICIYGSGPNGIKFLWQFRGKSVRNPSNLQRIMFATKDADGNSDDVSLYSKDILQR